MTRDANSTPAPSRRRRARGLLLAGALVACLTAMVFAVRRSNASEVRRLIEVLALRDGMRVAEVGAGTGWLTVEIGMRVGGAGRVYSTELSPRRLDQIRAAAAAADLTNVTVVQAGERSANLPPGCCDAVFMRRVYHHFTDPSAILLDLHAALVAGGRLVIIEFAPGSFLGTVTGMGTDETRLVTEVTARGFEVVRVDEWPGWGHYVAVFQKPVGSMRGSTGSTNDAHIATSSASRYRSETS